MPIKVLLADDTDLMRHAIRKLITGEPRMNWSAKLLTLDRPCS